MATNSSSNIPTAASGKVLQGQGVGTANAFSTATYPSVGGTSETILRSDGTNFVNSSAFKVSSGDIYTNTAQPSMKAVLTTTASNITGDGTVATIPFDTVSTNSGFDQGNNYNTSTYRFTAPVTGRYLVHCTVYLAGISASHNSGKIFILGNNTNNIGQYIFNPGAIKDVNNTCSVLFTQMLTFQAADFLEMQIAVYSSTKTISIGSDNFGLLSWFNVQLVN